MATVKIEEGPGRIEARTGEEITLEVSGANTTGYLWQLQTDSSAVEVVTHEVIPDNESFGGAGVERFIVKPVKAGDAVLHFQLKAPWEIDPVESHDVEVHSVSTNKTFEK